MNLSPRFGFPTILLLTSLLSCAPTVSEQGKSGVTSTTATPTKPPTASSTAPAPMPSTSIPAVKGFTLLAPLSATRVTSFEKPAQVLKPGRAYRAVLNTSKGTITLELSPKAAPVAVNNFIFLALNKFYDGTRFHRVIEGFMAQGGDPQSAELALKEDWGTGGPGYTFSAEARNGLRFDKVGVLGMARAASLDSQGSQFFITVAPVDFLSGEYTVFGQVVAGQDVLNKLTRNYSNSGPIPGAGADLLDSVQILMSE